MVNRNFKDYSKDNWFRSDGEKPTNEQLQLGCFQRIADATVAMAKPFIQATQDAEWYRKKSERLSEENQHLRNRIAGHKAAYTKLKNKIENDDINIIEEFCKEHDLCPICIKGGWNCGSDHK